MKAILTRISTALSSIQWQQILATCCVAVILLTTQIAKADLDTGVQNRLDKITAKGEDGRPRTSAQWQAENEALKGQPGEKLKRIGKESADAIEEMAEIYPQNAKTLTPGVDNGALPKDD